MSTNDLSILVVDDDPDILHGTAHVLQRAGYRVTEAASGEEALALFGKIHPSLLLLDRDLGSMDGLEVCRRIKADPATAECFVILASSTYVETQDRSEGLEAQADGYIVRPVANRELLARVAAYSRMIRLGNELRRKTEILEQAAASAAAAQVATLNLMEDATEANVRLETINRQLRREITVRERAEQALRESETLLKQAQNIASLGTYSLELPSGRWSSSEVLDRVFGIDHTYERTLDGWTALIHPDEQHVINDYFRTEVLGHHQGFDKEYRIVRPSDQAERWVWGLGKLELDEAGRAVRMRGVIQDITERKRAELDLLQQTRLRAALLELPLAVETLDEKAFMQRGQELAEDLTGSVISFIHFVHEDQQSIELVTWSRRTLEKYCHANYVSHYPVQMAGIWADALRERRPVTFNDYASYPKRHGLPEGHSPLQRLISVPVIENDRVVMMTGVGNKDTPYNEQDVKVVQLIGESIWRLVQRRRSDALLRKLSLAVEQSPAVIVITDLAGAIEYVNPRFTTLTGYTMQEVRGQNPRLLKSGLTPPAVFEEMWHTIIRGEVWRGELINRKKNGELFTETVLITPARNAQGQPTHFIALKEDITEKKRADQALRESEARYRELFDLESDAILVFDAETGRIIQANRAASEIYGRPVDQLVTITIEETSAEVDDTRATRNTLLQNVGQVVHIPLRRHRKSDGTIFPVEISMRGFHREDRLLVVAVIRDITEQVRTNERLRQFSSELEAQVENRTAELAARNREIEALLQSIPDLVMRLGHDGAVHYFQPAKGSTPLAGLVSKGAPSTVPKPPEGLLQAALSVGQGALAKIASVSAEVEVPLQSGSLAVELRAAPIGTEEFVVFARDISARRRLEAETNAMLERERQISEMKTRFISVTSHEFRTPMSAAMGSAELLHNHYDRLAPAKREELFNRISTSLHRMTEMLDDVLTLNRIDAKRVEVRLVNTELRHFVQNVIEEIRVGDRDAHRFELQLPPTATPFVTDTHLLHHILSNLLSNAVRYSPAGTRVTVQLAVDDAQARLTVQDEGIGIPTADHARIFEPFERGSNVGTIKGTGLGLNIVKRMTGLLGGSVTLDSPADGGTRFTLALPVSLANPPAGTP